MRLGKRPSVTEQDLTGRQGTGTVVEVRAGEENLERSRLHSPSSQQPGLQ